MKFSITLLSVLTLAGVCFGVSIASRSSLFTLASIEVESLKENPLLEDSTILELTGLKIGSTSLFEIDLTTVEKNILRCDLIKSVSLQKKIPHTLVIAVLYRVPVGIVQTAKGTLSYVDESGKIYGSLNLSQVSDLPLFSGFDGQNSEKIGEALRFLRAWENSPIKLTSMISSVRWQDDRGFRVLAAYPLNDKESDRKLTVPDFSNYARTMIDFGQSTEINLNLNLLRLSKVFKYLSGNSIAVRQIWAGTGKKIVVKTSHGS